MKFSEQFGIQVTEDEEWFDPILSVDTRLFIDPFLLYDQEQGVFQGSHDEVVSFFNAQFEAIARTSGRRDSNIWTKAESDLLFPEVEEICLGYTGAGTGGAGAGRRLARILAEGIWEAIEGGTTSVRHFEEIALIREGIGADRISDITATILRHRLASYTTSICERHRVSVDVARYPRGRFDVTKGRWVPLEFRLPRNPYNGKPILLSPRTYLRTLPTIEADDFWEYCYHNENDLLRARFGEDISKRVRKYDIVEIARQYPHVRGKYIAFREESGSEPYDVGKDTQGVYSWYEEAKRYCASHPRPLAFDSPESFERFAGELVGIFKHFVEENRGWALLWNDNKSPRREASCQDLFLGTVKHYCKANDIDISKEPNIGRGPVDFKVSSGFFRRALIEVKKADNTKFWNGLTEQLPTYQKAEEIAAGYFLVIAFNDKDLERVAQIQERVRTLNASLSYRIQPIVVDASYGPASASKL